MIRTLQKQTLSFDQLKAMVGPKNSKLVKWMLYDDLQNYNTIEQLFSKNKIIVILLEIENARAPRVGHFITLLDHGSHYEHFDSYGLNIDQENTITEEKHLTSIFQHMKKPLVQNTRKLQLFREDINTCGRWVVARILMNNLELDKFIATISEVQAPNDQTVTLLTMLLMYKN